MAPTKNAEQSTREMAEKRRRSGIFCDCGGLLIMVVNHFNLR
jgi:hypothetical protein